MQTLPLDYDPTDPAKGYIALIIIIIYRYFPYFNQSLQTPLPGLLPLLDSVL